MDFIVLAVGIAVGALIGWLLGQRSSSKAGQELAAAGAYATGLKERVGELSEALEEAQREMAAAREYAISMEAKKEALDTRLSQQQAEFAKAQDQLKLIFQNEANKIFDTVSKKFATQSETQIGNLLNPLRERLGEFQKKIDDSFSQQGKEQHTLKAEIEKIVLQTDSLTKALRGDVKAQGNWGEVMLERILEESGLRKDIDYVTQAVDMGLTSADGSRQRPDVIVKLPDDKHIIIDSKVSLTAYERYCDSGDAAYIGEFLKSVRAHVNGLESKKYQDNAALGTPDFVLMFLPLEGAYSLAVQKDLELHSYAWGKRIVLVCPSTLFATLRTIASLWSIERQNKNAQTIAAEAAKMYDKFCDFVNDLDKIGQRLGQLQVSYDEALGKLSKGRGNLVGRAEKLVELGAKPSKALSKLLITDEDGVA